MSRKKRLRYNTVSSILLQITTVICGLVVPRLILQEYGSEVNGLVQAIGKFLTIITFLEFGIGAVIQSSLYKPLAEKSYEKISCIVTSGEKYFKTIASILIVYIFILVSIFPFLVDKRFSWVYTGTLILSISISYFAQYYFGAIDRLLLNADQHGYIHYLSQIATLLLNTAASLVLIKLKAPIQLVKLVSSLCFLVRPICVRIYVNRHYRINRRAKYDEEPIQQKWNGVAQHVAYVVLEDTDTLVLTVFSTLANVSIYSVYHLVIYGVKQLFQSATSGVQSLLGELWARQDIDELKSFFSKFELCIHTLAVIIFTSAGVLIVPFVRIYTNGITDINYVQPLFAISIVIANATHCLRIPYNIMILAAGHYKQTQHNYIIAAITNLMVSILTVSKWGLVGVAIGTFVAMLYQTIWMAWYDNKFLIKRSCHRVIKLAIYDVICAGFICILTSRMTLHELNYVSWTFMAFQVVIVSIFICGAMGMICFRKDFVAIISNVSEKLIAHE